jgi:hypothetical protein
MRRDRRRAGASAARRPRGSTPAFSTTAGSRLRFGGLERGLSPTLAIDAFASPAAGDAENATSSPLVPDPGWLRTAGTTLRGMRLTRGARRGHGDRVIVL